MSARLRRPTLVTAPLTVLAVMGASAALAVFLWGVWSPDGRDATFYVVEAIALAVAAVAFIAVRGCFVDVDDERDEVRDVVAWRTRLRVTRSRIATARVRAGAVRWFELEMDDGAQHVLLGASPAQFPARLSPASRVTDVDDLDLLMGPDAGTADPP